MKTTHDNNTAHIQSHKTNYSPSPPGEGGGGVRPLLLVGLCFTLSPSLPAQSPPPNVIVLLADDLGYGDLSCYGATRVRTPNVDSLAQHGVRFTDAHAVASTSTPSRYSLLTGEYCFRRTGTDIATGDAGLIIRPEQYTLADMFRSRGYRTAAIGKWHLGLGSETGKQDWNRKLDLGLDSIGFDYYYIMAATADRVPCVFIENGEVVNYDPSAPISVSYAKNFDGEPTGAANPELLTKLRSSHGHNQSIVNGIGRIGYMKGGGRALWRDEDIADSIATAATRFIDQQAGEPFFMYLCTNDVHVPRMPNERFRGKSPMGLRGEAIMQFDYTVGLITEALRRNALEDNTLIIITSDNGPVLDDGYQDEAVALAGDHKPGGPWRGGKYSAFEAGTAVPFIVSWPGHTPEGLVSGALVSHIDHVASLAALVGADVPAVGASDSQNRLTTWLGQDQTPRPYALSMAQNRTLSLRTATHKYIEPSNGAAIQSDTKIETGYRSAPQLYCIRTDTAETKNLYSTDTETAARLATLLAEVRLPHESGDTIFWHHLVTPNRGPRYATSQGAGMGLVGRLTPEGTAAQWKFVRRKDGTFDIVNRADGSFLTTGTYRAQNPEQIKTAALPPATGWTLTTNGKMRCLYAVVNGTSQLNQSVNAPAYVVLNWGGGTNTTDAGCVYSAVLADAEVSNPSAVDAVRVRPAADFVLRQGTLVSLADGAPVTLYDISGKRLRSDALPPAGVYVARVGGETFKVAF